MVRVAVVTEMVPVVLPVILVLVVMMMVVVVLVMVIVVVVRGGPEGTICHFLDHPGSDPVPFLGEVPTNKQIHLPL